jgi:hypothetical protein
MKRMILSILVFTPNACFALNLKQLTSPESARKALDSVMTLVAKDDIVGAFKQLEDYSLLPTKELEELARKTIAQRKQVAPRFGRILGIQFVKEERVGDFLLRYTYVEKREMHAMRWRFVLYRPGTTWNVNSVVWDDNLQELIGP